MSVVKLTIFWALQARTMSHVQSVPAWGREGSPEPIGPVRLDQSSRYRISVEL